MNANLNELKRACLASDVAIDLVHAAENDFAAARDEYRAALASGNNFHAADRALDAAHATREAARDAARDADRAVADAHDAHFAVKELERLENKASDALSVYLATPLDAADIVPLYAKYKDAYAALSYARCFNLDNNN